MSMWRTEVRIFDSCIQRGREIVAELSQSGGDHHEDVEAIEGLMEVWACLRDAAEEEGLNEAYAKKAAS